MQRMCCPARPGNQVDAGSDRAGQEPDQAGGTESTRGQDRWQPDPVDQRAAPTWSSRRASRATATSMPRCVVPGSEREGQAAPPHVGTVRHGNDFALRYSSVTTTYASALSALASVECVRRPRSTTSLARRTAERTIRAISRPSTMTVTRKRLRGSRIAANDSQIRSKRTEIHAKCTNNGEIYRSSPIDRGVGQKSGPFGSLTALRSRSHDREK